MDFKKQFLFKPIQVLASIVVYVCAVYEASAQTLINVDFGAGTAASLKVGFAATGLSANDFWNFYTRDDGQGGYLSFGSLNNLSFADGAPSGAGLTIANAPGSWGNHASDPMYDGYLYPFDGNSIVVVVTNLPAATYDLYLYGHGDNASQNGVFQVNNGSTDLGTQATTTSGNVWQTANWQEGQQYVVFRGVSVTNGQPLTITVLQDAGGYAIISGLQLLSIIPVTTSGRAPVITNQPAISQSAAAGCSVSFSVTASGDAPLTYQWFKNDLIPGATNPVFTLNNVQPLNAGSYHVVAKNAAGSASSSSSFLNVFPGRPITPLPPILPIGPQPRPLNLIDVDFGAGTAASLEVGYAATGQSSNDFWNFYTRDAGQGGWLSFGTLNNLQYANGTVSGAGLTISNAPGAWGNNAPDPMYAGYLYPFDGGSITVTVTNLTPGIYNVYLYGHGETTDQNSVFQLSSGGSNYGTQFTANTGNIWQTANWQEGQQYVVFENALVTASHPLTITVLPDTDGYAIISGMQLVQRNALLPILPVLPVRGTPVLTTSQVGLFMAPNASNQMTVSFTGQIGRSYQILVADTASGPWTVLYTTTLTQPSCTWVDPTSTSMTHRFYRVLLLP